MEVKGVRKVSGFLVTVNHSKPCLKVERTGRIFLGHFGPGWNICQSVLQLEGTEDVGVGGSHYNL